jgi:hypothetical protein
VNEFLDHIALRLRVRRTLARAGWALLLGTAVAGILVAVGATFHIPHLQPIVGGLLGATAIVCVGLFFTVRFSRAEAAQVADLVLATQSLFVTANDPSQSSTHDAHDACAERAALTAAETSPAAVVPLRFGARWAVCLLPCLLVAALFAAPLPQPPIPPAAPVDVAQAAAHLDKLADKLEKRANVEDLQRAERLRRLSRRLKTSTLSKRAALEELGELKRELRAEKLQRETAARKAQRAAEAAGKSLGEGEATRQLGNELAKGARARTQAERDAAAKKAKEELRELAKLGRQEREKAAQKLEEAARQARAQGNEELAQALEAAAGSVRSGDPNGAEAAGNQLAEAMRNLGSENRGGNQELREALSAAQAALDGQPMPGGGPGEGGDEGDITPGPRNWRDGGPGGDPANAAAAGAGKGHSDVETPAGAPVGDHQDANRFSDRQSDSWSEEYRELYEAALLNSDSRITTRVKGERSGDGKVQVVRGGQQAPRQEQARGAIANLPVRYADEAREAVDGETVPPAYRDAVRGYFDAEK